jgi:superfamily II DNA or RNA helicase
MASVSITPLNRKTDRLKLSTPKNALEFHRNEILQTAAGRKFELEHIPTTKPVVCIKVKDGHGRSHSVEVYGKFSSFQQCSCLEYIEEECNFCVHIAAVQNLLNNSLAYGKQTSSVTPWVSEYMGRLKSLPWRLDAYKQPVAIYDSYRKTEVLYGLNKHLQQITSVSSDTFRKVIKLQSNSELISSDGGKAASAPNPDGILKGDLELYDYQKLVFARMIGAKRAICSMIMGSGKTLVSIACCGWIQQNYKPEAKFLIICPKSLRNQWGREFERALGVKVCQVDAKTDLGTAYEKYPVLVTTYQFLTRHIERFQKEIPNDFDGIVVDEVQFVKNSDTKTWKAINQLESEFFYGLSGTVIENRLDDLYSIMEIIATGALGPKWRFDDRFQNLLAMSRSKIVYKGVKNLDKLHEALRDHVFSYDQLKLPDISYHFIRTALTNDEKTYHDSYMEEARKLIAKVMNGYGNHFDKLRIQAFLLKARQSCNSIELLTKKPTDEPSAKLKEFKKTIEQLCVTEGEKVVVFSEWTEMLGLCRREVENLTGFVMYTGEQSLKKRDAALLKFQTDPDCRIFFASDAGGIGLDGLQLVCRNVLHLELPWNPARLDQRTGRIYRIPQKNEVRVFHLVSDGAIELQIETLLQEKRSVRQLTLQDLTV